MLKRLSDTIAIYISKNLKSDRDKIEIYSYGLQIFLGTAFEIIFIIITAYLLNTLKSTIVVLVSFILFRRLLGGTHCTIYRNCFFVSGFSMLLLGFIGDQVVLSSKYLFVLLGLAYIFSVIQTIRYIPMGTEKKMIKNSNTRLKIKIQTILLLSFWMIIIYLLKDKVSSKYIFSSLLGVIGAFFFSTPFSYKIINHLEIYLNFLTKGGKKQNV
ncbi:accessory gene regulator ArgB-like protein [Crassaminicella indica]|uniref:Accessory gene regulator B family protein n=1 Tax=Crassaminicella indica TaxID=2855394 RepID=A0ABX8RCQ6_9CLOT|nr:accessory gene regulator B family protein [Crassaminicella indica]QXM06234.1 accessory gene regulator B family protein [Crassaminicella indica]